MVLNVHRNGTAYTAYYGREESVCVCGGGGGGGGDYIPIATLSSPE